MPTLTSLSPHTIDRHNIVTDRTSPDLSDYESILQSIQQPTLVVAIDSDILYPPVERQIGKFNP
ncbi:hypothetical protein [Nostoc sp.]